MMFGYLDTWGLESAKKLLAEPIHAQLEDPDLTYESINSTVLTQSRGSSVVPYWLLPASGFNTLPNSDLHFSLDQIQSHVLLRMDGSIIPGLPKTHAQRVHI